MTQAGLPLTDSMGEVGEADPKSGACYQRVLGGSQRLKQFIGGVHHPGYPRDQPIYYIKAIRDGDRNNDSRK